MRDDIIIIKPNYNRDHGLSASLAKKILYPVLLGEFQGSLYLIDGYLRYRASPAANFATVHFDTMEDLFTCAVEVNSAVRELHLLEKAFLIAFAARHKLAVQLSSLFNTKVGEETILQAQKITSLPEFFFPILQNHRISFKQIQSLLHFSREELEHLRQVFEICRFSQNNFYRFLEDLHHFLRSKGQTSEQFLSHPDVREILGQSSPYEKGENLLKYLFRQLKPVYWESLDKLDQLKKRLRSANIEVAYNPNFEDDFYRISFDVSRREDIEKIWQLLHANRENLYRLLEVIHGEG